MQNNPEIWRLPRVKAETGLGKTHIYGEMAAARFPKSVALSGRTRGWVAGEVRDWIAARIAERDRVAACPAPTAPNAGRQRRRETAARFSTAAVGR
jgi:prophage regulatory protein